MFTCNECQSTDFEKADGFLVCAVCHVQHPDYVEQSVEFSSNTLTRVLRLEKEKRENQIRIFTKEWTQWDAYNYILHGFVQDLIATGFAPASLSSNTISVWSCFLETTKSNEKLINTRFGIGNKKSSKKLKEKNEGRKKMMNEDFENMLSQSKRTGSTKKLMYEKHRDFLSSQSTEACSTQEELTLESLPMDISPHGHASQSSSPRRPRRILNSKKAASSSKSKKCVRMTKGRLLEILHISLLIGGSELHLSDLMRFIREAHLSFAKVTHFLPPEMKITRGDTSHLETLQADSMPKHAQQRKFGAELAKKLGIKQFPFPNMKSLITRYCKELNLPDQVIDRALVISKWARMEKSCQELKREIPNYEGMAAACIIYSMKVLMGLDDRTEFLLSDMAEKANRFLDSENDLLFSFNDWQKFIELRKTVVKEVHYPTEEKLCRSDFFSPSGLIDMLLKESKDSHKAERFTAYSKYFMEPDVTKACEDVLTALSQPKRNFKMEFPPSLTPLASYLDSILDDYEARLRNSAPSDADIPELHPRALEMLKTSYADRDLSYVLEPRKYEKLLAKNGFAVKKISKLSLWKTNEVQPEGGSQATQADGEKCKSFQRLLDQSKINYVELAALKEVYLVEGTAFTWELPSPSLQDKLEASFMVEVFQKTPVNFQWFVREFGIMLEMTERDIYLQLYKLEGCVREKMKSISKALAGKT